jgi:phage gp46-like protein
MVKLTTTASVLERKAANEGVDFALLERAGGDVDLAVVNGDLAMDQGLVTFTLASLWTDRRADPDDGLSPADDPRGYWADRVGDRWGSKLWLLARQKALEATLRNAEAYAHEGLTVMRQLGMAQRVRASAAWGATGELQLTVRITRNPSSQWESAWAGTDEEVSLESDRRSLRLLFN